MTLCHSPPPEPPGEQAGDYYSSPRQQGPHPTPAHCLMQETEVGSGSPAKGMNTGPSVISGTIFILGSLEGKAGPSLESSSLGSTSGQGRTVPFSAFPGWGGLSLLCPPPQALQGPSLALR